MGTAIQKFQARNTIWDRQHPSTTLSQLTNLRHRQRNGEATAVYLRIIRRVLAHVTNPALTYPPSIKTALHLSLLS